MAYIDKITSMRRMALITDPIMNNGSIELEGVNIEGVCVLKTVSTSKLVSLHQSQIEDFARKRNLVVVYQDPVEQDFWEPREQVRNGAEV